MSTTFRVSKLVFKTGSGRGQPSLEIDPPQVTIFVGPNNAGKSEALREIESFSCGRLRPPIIFQSVEVEHPDEYDEVKRMLSPFETEPPRDRALQPGNLYLARPTLSDQQQSRIEVAEQSLETWLQTAAQEKSRRRILGVLGEMFVARLDGKTRFSLVQPMSTHDLQEPAKNHLAFLFQNLRSREKVREFTKDAFDRHFVVDPTAMTQFRIRLSERAPESVVEEQSLDPTSVNFHRAASLISDLGDGVQASVGLVAAVMSLPARILLIDEPEAFLHPTLARRLGRLLADTAHERDASMFIATHGADFLMGCISSAPDLRLIRLTFHGGEATARSIEPIEVEKLMKDPLLRSANAFRALFHHSVIVTEADADRAFYDEINYRLQQRGRGLDDALFMNAQNWQTIPRIVAPLRR